MGMASTCCDLSRLAVGASRSPPRSRHHAQTELGVSTKTGGDSDSMRHRYQVALLDGIKRRIYSEKA